jgi:TolB protein
VPYCSARQPGLALSHWRAAQAPVTGRVTGQTDGRIMAEFGLWDVFGKVRLDGQLYLSMPDNFPRIAHIISDRIYERLTGEKGYFDSRIVFVDETVSQDGRMKRLAMMDQDGNDVRYLTDAEIPCSCRVFRRRLRKSLTFPSARTSGASICSTSKRNNERSSATSRMTFSPRFTPDGQRVIMSLQQGSNASLFVDGSALQGHDAAYRRRRHRYRAMLLARWQPGYALPPRRRSAP